MQVTVDIEDLGTLLRYWRGGMSASDVSRRVSEALGRSVSYMTITRYEENKFPKGEPDVALLVAIIEAVGHHASELPEEYQDGVRKLKELMSRSTCFAEGTQRAA